ncbi:autotransporter outer membrane beta-barrel domain-containing protein, partial [Escherichia sp. TWPC-MK]
LIITVATNRPKHPLAIIAPAPAKQVAANRARVSQSQGDDIQMRLGLHSEWRTAVHVIPTLDLNYYHDPHSTEIEEDGSTISDDAVKQRGEIKVGVTGKIITPFLPRHAAAQGHS